MSTTALHHELRGSGPPVVLLHHGIADSCVWDPQWQGYTERFRVLRLDLAGFGRSPVGSMPVGYARDVAQLLDDLGIEDAAIVGASLGGRVALELGVARPDLVGSLVLVGAATSEALAVSPAMQAYGAALEEAFERDGFAGAVEVDVRMWVDGPHREPDAVDPAVREKVATMQRDAYLLTGEFDDDSWSEEPLVAGLPGRLAALEVPALIVVGELDVDVIHEQGEMLRSTIPGARLETLPATAHVPNLERPAAFDALVVPFLAEHGGPRRRATSSSSSTRSTATEKG